MTPCVTSNLVAVIVHSLDQRWISCLWIVDLSLASVVADDEEGGFNPLGLKKVKEI